MYSRIWRLKQYEAYNKHLISVRYSYIPASCSVGLPGLLQAGTDPRALSQDLEKRKLSSGTDVLVVAQPL